jgi:uracil DNA glycosylase
MSYHSTQVSIERAQGRSRWAIVELVNNICALATTQSSSTSILRYMMLAYCYKINYVIIGQSPYPDHIVPHMGSAYSQSLGSNDTATTRVICQHFTSDNGIDSHVRLMIRNNWQLLERGYLFVNSDYCFRSSRSAIEHMEVYDRTVEYICSVCTSNRHTWCNSKVHIIALGTIAHHVGVLVSSRLRAMGIYSVTTLDGQPARLARLTYGGHKVGTCDSYSCLSATTKSVFREATKEWLDVQGGYGQYNYNTHAMSESSANTISTVFMATIGSLIEQLCAHLNTPPPEAHTQEDLTFELFNKHRAYSEKSTRLLYELACALAADTGVKQTISERIIASAAANSQFKRPTESVVSSGAQMPINSPVVSIAARPQSSMGGSVSTPNRASAFDRIKSRTPNKANGPPVGATTMSNRSLDHVQSSVPVSNIVTSTPASTSKFDKLKKRHTTAIVTTPAKPMHNSSASTSTPDTLVRSTSLFTKLPTKHL